MSSIIRKENIRECDSNRYLMQFIANFIAILCVYLNVPVNGIKNHHHNFLAINPYVPSSNSMWDNKQTVNRLANNHQSVFMHSGGENYPRTKWVMENNNSPQLNNHFVEFRTDKRKNISISSKQDNPEHTKPKLPRIPGLPNDIPLPTINITNVVTLIDLAASDSEIDDPTEALLVQTLSELATFVGVQDVRDFLGIFLMYFMLGPILIPMFWMPIALLAMGFLMIPLVYNTQLAAAAAGKTFSYSYNSFGNNGFKRKNDTTSHVHGKEQENYWESQCLEMFSCEVNNMLRSSSWSNWITRTFNLTKVEWAAAKARRKSNRRNGSSKSGTSTQEAFFEQDDCSKYKCVLVKPVQRFFGNWYSYFFTYQNQKQTR